MNDMELQERMKIDKDVRQAFNRKMLEVPRGLTEEEKEAYEKIAMMLLESIHYKLSAVDMELIWQFCQMKVMRDRAWRKYNENPERYIRIVTGICNDGKTPKVQVRENEHYRTLQDCNRHLEKILKDLRLTPEMRRKI